MIINIRNTKKISFLKIISFEYDDYEINDFYTFIIIYYTCINIGEGKEQAGFRSVYLAYKKGDLFTQI